MVYSAMGRLVKFCWCIIIKTVTHQYVRIPVIRVLLLQISSLAVAVTVASAHCGCSWRDNQASLASWPV